jgi:hypothetical protein
MGKNDKNKSKPQPAPAPVVTEPVPQPEPAEEPVNKMDTQQEQSNGAQKRGPGRPPSGTPPMTREERAARDAERRRAFAALSPRDKLAHRLEALSEYAEAVLEDCGRIDNADISAACGAISGGMGAIYAAVTALPDDFKMPRREGGERAPRTVPTYAAGARFNFREKFAQKWAPRFDVTTSHAMQDQEGDYIFLQTKAGFLLGIPLSHLQAA